MAHRQLSSRSPSDFAKRDHTEYIVEAEIHVYQLMHAWVHYQLAITSSIFTNRITKYCNKGKIPISILIQRGCKPYIFFSSSCCFSFFCGCTISSNFESLFTSVIFKTDIKSKFLFSLTVDNYFYFSISIVIIIIYL